MKNTWGEATVSSSTLLLVTIFVALLPTLYERRRVRRTPLLAFCARKIPFLG
jgi:hypothetical protein